VTYFMYVLFVLHPDLLSLFLSQYSQQEIMTDPSYKGQFVAFTCPHIGNVGINSGGQKIHCNMLS
jgi:hypothetical protein